MATAAEQETEEEALERKQQYEQERQQHGEKQERRAEAWRLEEEQREQEYEAERVRREELRQTRRATFERILENTPSTLSAAQLRVLLRAIVNLDPYTFADDLAEDVADQKSTAAPRKCCWRPSLLPQITSCPTSLSGSHSLDMSIYRARTSPTSSAKPMPSSLLCSRGRGRRRPASLRSSWSSQTSDEEAEDHEEADRSLTRSGSQPIGSRTRLHEGGRRCSSSATNSK